MKTSIQKFGFSTLELLIAFAVATIFFTGTLLVAFGGQSAGLDTTLSNRGIYTVMNQIHDAVASTTQNWGASVAPAPWANAFYTQTNSVTDISQCLKFVTATTSWSSEKSRPRYVFEGTFLASTSASLVLGRNCDPFPPNDPWDSPKKLPNGISIASINPTDVSVVNINGKRIAMLSSVASAVAKEDIDEIDITDPQNPVLLGQLNTGKGINAVAVAGMYAFALQNDSTNQLQVIRLFDTTKSTSDPLHYLPALITQVPLQNVAGSFPEGRSIAYYNNKLYIGTWNNNIPATSPEFLIYDVTTPTTPTFLGSNNVGHSINSIAIKDSNAYLATTNNTGELMVMNITNSGSPSVLGQYDFPSNTNDAEEVYVLGQYAYLGLDRATGSNKDFLVINISNPASPSLTGSLKLNMNTSGAMVSGISVVNGKAFVGTTDTNAEFRVLDVSNPADPKANVCGPYNYSAKISALEYSNGYIVTANQANVALTIVYDTPGTICN